MAILVADRVQETTSTAGTGTLTLAGALAGYQAFSTAFAAGGQVYYGIVNGVQWEVGYGTYTVVGTTLSRSNILASSNGGTAITLSGTSNVFCDFPAALATILTNTSGTGNVVLSTGATLVTPNIGAATSAGIVATTTFAPAFTDGTVVDYTTGNGRISVGSADTITLYTGGVATTPLATFAGTGLTLPNGTLSVGTFSSTFTDGLVADYATGNGRISVGVADTITLYAGGIATTSIGQFATTGATLPNGSLAIGTFSSAFTDGTVVDYATGNGRISVGAADNVTVYNGGIAATKMAAFTPTGLQVVGAMTSSGNLYSAISAVTISTAGAGVLTAAGMAAGIISRTGPTAGYTDTTDTAANIVAAVPNAQVGTALYFRVLNTVAFAATAPTAGVGVTMAAAPYVNSISASSFREYVAVITNVATPAVTIYGVGSGAI